MLKFPPKKLVMSEFNMDDYSVIRRNGNVQSFDAQKIKTAILKAFMAQEGEQALHAQHVNNAVDELMLVILESINKQRPSGGAVHIEAIQDEVEKALMKQHYHVAKRYVLYREERTKARRETFSQAMHENQAILVQYLDGLKPLHVQTLYEILERACVGLQGIQIELILQEAIKNLHNGVKFSQVMDCIILAIRTLIEKNPDYSFLAARVLVYMLHQEVFADIADIELSQTQHNYEHQFINYLQKGVNAGLLSDALLNKFDLTKLASSLKADRDLQFNYLGLQTLYDRYFLHISDARIELPQWFFMRVSMGLALNEQNPTEKSIEFYELLSQFYFMSSTPTLFNSGTLRSQLSSCYLTTIDDDLEGIYDGLKENALLSKFAGGLGNDWTNVRALGSWIKGTNGKSQGVIPFLKVVNDTAVAVNQGGKRKGAVCAYLETWHLDIEEFLELRKNTGDDRRRCHDMNSANWIPDLFMKRVMRKEPWTLFTPSDVPDLHDLYGKAFEERYHYYEQEAKQGNIKLYKQIPALDLWRKMLSMLFETGHPWITFKDPCNIRSPQQHVGVVHSSNLCTEITLNTNKEEIAVCNLGSVNLVKHLVQKEGVWQLDLDRLQKTISIAMRMLDNVIDINYYAVKKAEVSNFRHRPVGMGLMGFQDCLHLMNTSYASNKAVDFADESTEALAYFAYEASSDLALERGCYSSYKGSLWDKGILPHDSLQLLAEQRGQEFLEINTTERMNWQLLREKIAKQGMRNSNCVAIAPTATISNIIGVSACIEPTYQNLYVKSNLSGEFTVINQYLVEQLKQHHLWDDMMIADLKYFDGSVQQIDRIPQHLKTVYATAFEVDADWIVEAASRRQKWIDQAQSLNIYLAGASGKKLDQTYKTAWLKGLKTTYYLRTMGATHAEKSTVRSLQLNAVPQNSVTNSTSNTNPVTKVTEGAACYLRPGDTGFDECEACQ